MRSVFILQIDKPSAFQCPVTLESMIDPVIASDGFTYERKTLKNLHRYGHRSPLTRESLNPNIIIPNLNLKKMIRDYEYDVVDIVKKYKDK